ncbi:MAG: dTDP-4-dehydrorhamnose 3,5-epimerase [Kineosporiaceae bacterium]
MKFTPTALDGPVLVELDVRSDDRGFFARAFCRQEFTDAGLVPPVEQANLSLNHRAGTVRGMHHQLDPAPEAKLVRCIRGAIVDVALDVREGSPTRWQHVMVELSAANRLAFYVPPYFAHGYQTLVDDTEVLYQVSAPYAPDAERGLRPDDPALGIAWPLPFSLISDKDRSWPLLESGS